MFSIQKHRVYLTKIGYTLLKREENYLATIDIDKLLLATEEMAEESIPVHLYTFDIDKLLDKTDNW